jgi:hypothetical protein
MARQPLPYLLAGALLAALLLWAIRWRWDYREQWPSVTVYAREV